MASKTPTSTKVPLNSAKTSSSLATADAKIDTAMRFHTTVKAPNPTKSLSGELPLASLVLASFLVVAGASRNGWPSTRASCHW